MNSYLKRGLAAASIALAVAGCATPNVSAATVPQPSEAEIIATLRQDLQALVDRRELPGAIVKIQQDGKLLADIRVGYQDVAAQKPLPPDAIFRLYSMSKPITSVAIMMLAEQGKLDLDDPLSKYLPEFTSMRVYDGGTLEDMETVAANNPIRIKDLLTHSSGLTYHFTGDTPVHRYYRKYGVMRDTPVGRTPQDGPPARTLDELVRRLASAPLLRQPGTQFDYSYSTTVLGAVIETVTGRTLDVALEEMIFDPLEMTNTGFFVEGPDLSRFVTNYVASADGLTAIETVDTTDYRDRGRLLDGGGALASTASDYLNFLQMLANNGVYNGRRILTPASVDAMFTPHVRMEGVWFLDTEFGYGFSLGNADSAAIGMQPAGTASWSGSANTYFFVDHTNRAVGLLMTHVIAPPPFAGRSLEFRGLVNKAAEALIEPRRTTGMVH